MTTNLGPWPGNKYPPVRAHATANITPFTYYDGLSFLEVLEALRAWLRETLIPGLDGIIEIVDGMIQDALENVAVDLAVMRQELDDALASIELTDTELRAYVDDVLQQVINNSIELQDAVLAGIVRDGESESVEELNKRYELTDSVWINASNHGYVGDGRDETSVIQSLIDGAQDGATIKLPEGSAFSTSGLRVEAKSITLDMTNTHATLTSQEPFVYAEGEWEAPLGVSTQTGGTLSVPNSSFSTDDYVKLISRDSIWDARPHSVTGDTPRQGEWGIVSNVINSDTVVINPAPVDTYTTDISLIKAIPHKVVVKFGTLTDAGPKGQPFRRHLISFVGLIRPELSGEIISGKGIACQARNCYGGDFDIKFTGLPFADGYGITLSGSVACRVKVNGERSRHAFTDNPAGYGYTGEPDTQGRPMYNMVYDSIVFSGATTAFDTHHGSYGEKFVNCHVVGVQSGFGFNLRGLYHALTGCSASSVSGGFRVYTETRPGADQWASSHGHVLNGCSTQNVNTAIDVSVVSRKANRPDSITVSGGRYEFGSSGFIRADRGRVRLDGVSAYMRAEGANSGNAIIFGTSFDISGKFYCDVRALNNGIMGVIGCTPGSATDIGWMLNVELLTGEGVDNFTNLVNWGPARGRIDFKTLGPEYTGPVSSSAAPRRLVTFATAGGARTSASFTTTRNTSGTPVELTSADPEVVMLVEGVGSGVVLGEIAPGRVVGQKLTVISNVADRKVRIVDDPALNTMLGADILIGGYESASIIWTGQYWVRA